MPEFTIGLNEADHLSVATVSIPGAGCGDYYNNIEVEIHIKAGNFSGCYGAWFDLHDFIQLRADFDRVYNALSESAKFETIDGEIEFDVIGDGRGHFEIRGIAGDTMVVRNQLHFVLEIDQSFIPSILTDLDEIIRQFTV